MSDDLYKKVAVIIQGPIISKGRTAKTRDLPVEQVTDADVVTYDCSQNVADMISGINGRFGRAICVTWASEDVSNIVRQVGAEAVLQIPDTTRTLDARNHIIPGNNKYRQFTSMLAGLRQLKSFGFDYALKIRTDQTLDLDALAAHLIGLDQAGQLQGRIIVPAYKSGMAFGVEDFYFGARYDVLMDFCEAYLGHGCSDFAFSVHCDIFGKVAFSRIDRHMSVPLASYFLANDWDPKTPSQKQVCRRAWSDLFATFPRKIWEGALWRGSLLGPYPGNRYSDDPDGALMTEILKVTDTDSLPQSRLNSFVDYMYYSDWERLFGFVLGERGREIGALICRFADSLRSLHKIVRRA